MNRLLPDSIAGRTLLALLFGLTLSHLASLAIYYGDRADALASLGGSQIIERIVAITRLMRNLPSDERTRIVKAVNGPTLWVSWGRESLRTNHGPTDWRTRFVKRSLTRRLGARVADRLWVGRAETDGGSPFAEQATTLPQADPSAADSWSADIGAHMRYMVGGAPGGLGLRISFRLDDGSWLNFAAPVEAVASFWSLRFVLSLTVMAFTVIVLSAWVVRRFTAPLATFARAAQHLGVDVHAPPLAEAGPREVRQATRAFNEMQRRLRKFIDDRTLMIAAISHDLRTPLTRMRLRAEFVEDAEQRAKMLDDLQEMEAMIASVLSFARDETSVEPQEGVDLAALIDSVCANAAEAGRPVTFLAQGGAAQGETVIPCRPLALRRAIANLVDNAVKYGGVARVALIEAEGRVTIRIDDDGPGIAEAERERVFAPFYRMERSRNRATGGAGLGLAVARTIVRAHGGDIALNTSPEGGLRVEVILPR